MRFALALTAIVYAGLPAVAPAETAPAVLASRLAQRIAAHVDPGTLLLMTAAIQGNDFLSAAQLATGTSGYGDVFLFNLVAPMCTLQQSVNTNQNPCTATLQYIAWSGKPWTDALTGNYFASFTAPSLTPVSATDNQHYIDATNAFNSGMMSYTAAMTTAPQTIQVNSAMVTTPDPMGAMTLVQALADSGSGGTNRRFVQLLFRGFMGIELAAIEDASFGAGVPLDGIRQDVFNAAPDAGTLTKTCATCHGGIDRVAAAFNGYDDTASQPTYQTSVTQKLMQRELAMPAGMPGFKDSANAPQFNSWKINWTTSPYGTFAWGAATGNGANALGTSFAATLEFRINVVNRIWKLACGSDFPTTGSPTLPQFAQYMQTTAGDQVTPMVMQIATDPRCLGR